MVSEAKRPQNREKKRCSQTRQPTAKPTPQDPAKPARRTARRQSRASCSRPCARRCGGSEDLSEPQKKSATAFADRLLEAVDPQDEVEAILAVQMITAHVAAMEVMRRAMADGQPAHGVEANVRQAQKLLGLFIRQLEVLNAHRGEPTRRVDVTYHPRPSRRRIRAAPLRGGSLPASALAR